MLKMETKVPDFVKLKTYNCIVFTDFQHTKLYRFQNLSLGFILEIFLKFRKFQPRYSYKNIFLAQKECTVRVTVSVLNSLFIKCSHPELGLPVHYNAEYKLNDIEPNVKPQNHCKRIRIAPKLHTTYKDN